LFLRFTVFSFQIQLLVLTSLMRRWLIILIILIITTIVTNIFKSIPRRQGHAEAQQLRGGSVEPVKSAAGSAAAEGPDAAAQELEAALDALNLSAFLEPLRATLGAASWADVAVLHIEDLEFVGFSRVQARRLLQLAAQHAP
jgi:hypothetical protein